MQKVQREIAFLDSFFCGYVSLEEGVYVGPSVRPFVRQYGPAYARVMFITAFRIQLRFNITHVKELINFMRFTESLLY